MKYVVFASIFLVITHWLQAKLLISSLGKEKSPVTFVENQHIQDLVEEHTGYKITNIKIVEADHPYGMMIGLPGKPQLILSRGLFDNFEPNSLEYVVLHESAHYRFHHSIKQLLVLIVCLVVGIVLLKFTPNTKFVLFLTALVGLILGVFFLQIAKLNEYQADRYAAQHISDPQGMIDATENFENYFGDQKRNKLLQFLFYRGVPYQDRIKIAEQEKAKTYY